MKKINNNKRLLIFSSMLVAGAFVLGGCAAQAEAEVNVRDYFNIPAGAQTTTYVGAETYLAFVSPTESKAEHFTITVVDDNGEEVPVNNNKFTPETAGQYKCYYAYALNGENYSYDYTITASVKDGPVFHKAPEFPYAFLAGREYTLPTLTAVDYSQNGATATVSVAVAGTTEADYKFTPVYNGVGTEAEVVYTATVGGKTETLTAKVPVLNPAFASDKSVDVTELFVSTGFASKKLTEEAIVYSTTTDAELQFANLIYGVGTEVQFGFGDEDKAEALTVTYTSLEDPSVALALRYEKGKISTGTGKVILNGGNAIPYEYEPYKQLSISYNAKRSTLVGVGGVELFKVTKDINGNPFNGFPGGLVKVSIAVEDVYGDVDVSVYKIANQNFGGVTRDQIQPTVNRDSMPIEYQVGEVITFKSAYVTDVIDPYATVNVTVKHNNQLVRDINGNPINKTDGTKDIQFVAEKRGQYVVTTQIEDGAGNFNIMPLTTNLYVYDETPPEIKISGDIPTSVAVGGTVTFPKITAEDVESGDKVILQLLIIRESMHTTQVAVDDDNRNGCVIDGAKYTFTNAGTYTIRIVATDESFNSVAKEYKIVCGA